MVCERVAFEGLRAAAGAPRDQQQAQQVQAGTDDDRVERGVDDSDDTDLEEEMMRVDPAESEWRRQLHEGDPVDAQNVFGNWCPAMLLRILDGEARVQYLNMNDSWTRWLPLDSGQLAPPATRTRHGGGPLRLAQQVEVRRHAGQSAWTEAFVVRARPTDVRVRYAGRQQQFDEWIPLTPATAAPAGDHLAVTRGHARQQLPVPAREEALGRKRLLQEQNPRFAHYREALAASERLEIHAVQGDGNCLFRAVSHQVYGDDAHHALVRARCMDYMESEKEYFEPYVVGDMAAFERYLAHKRRPGVWGDDPELQALCELYDRPADVFAYDASRGYCKLRTFHENSALLARDRPPIRLSYYGGGHYDSLVGTDHAANLIREPPGDWERRHIGFSRRINTREPADVDMDERHARAESDREVTEVDQLEHVLMLSRNEFDAMNANLDETLQRALAESAGQSAASAQGHAQRELADVQEATRQSEMAAIQAELIAKAKEASEDELMRAAIQASLAATSTGRAERGDAASFFDADVDAAIQASLREAGAAPALTDDYDEQLRRAMELSVNEFDVQGFRVAGNVAEGDAAANADEMDELQRAIQASLQQP